MRNNRIIVNDELRRLWEDLYDAYINISQIVPGVTRKSSKTFMIAGGLSDEI
jgi:hypothetical protein